MNLTAHHRPLSLILLAVACGAGPPSTSIQPAAQPAAQEGATVTVAEDLHVTTLATVPFAGAFEDRVSTLGLGMGPREPVRLPPVVRLDDAGQPWLLHGAVAVRPGGAVVALQGLGTSATTFAPRRSGDVIVLGRSGATDVVARVRASGEVAWRNDAVMSGRVTDLLQDGSRLWASGADKGGPIVPLDPETGTTGGPVDLGGYRGRVVAGQGALWRIVAESGTRRWVRQPAASGSPAPAALQPTSARALGPLPDGGVLLVDRTTLTWARAGGGQSTFHWRGVARTGDAIAYAEGQDLVRLHAHDGPVEISGLPPEARLIARKDDAWVFVGPGEDAHAVDAAGTVSPLTLSAQDRVAMEAKVDLSGGVVTPEGDLVVAGVDRSGAFVLQLGR